VEAGKSSVNRQRIVSESLEFRRKIVGESLTSTHLLLVLFKEMHRPQTLLEP
jgi:hypothetical protein